MSDINRTGSSIVDSSNSSSTILPASGVFTGPWKEVLEFAHITIQIKASHVSAVDGLQIEWSSDAVNIDDTDVFTIPANKGKVFTFGPQAKYFRVTYINGVTTQTFFRLQIILKQVVQKSSTHRLKDSIVEDDDVELVKAVLAGSDNGAFKNVQVTSDGRLKISQEVTIPTGTTPVERVAQSSITIAVDDLYTITNGKTLTLQRLQAGSQVGIGGSQVILYEDPNGNLSVLNLITVLYVNGASAQADLSKVFIGNGTRRIIMRRLPFSGGAREIFGRWEGFEQ